MKEKDRQILLAIMNYIGSITRTHTLFKNDKEIFLSNNDYQYSIAFAILQIGELVGNLDIQLKDKIQIKSLRNRIIHGYGSIDLDLLWEISHKNIKELRDEIEQHVGL
jgi:uncharacterized protein with HEPN domain